LTDLFRQARGSQIILAAHQVNHGEEPAIANDAGHDLFFIEAEPDERVIEAIKILLSERIPGRFGLDPVDDVQVIAPMHNGTAGVTSLNTHIQALLNPPGPGRAEIARGNRVFRVGDKVMQIRNNYDKDIYNGDLGRITSVSVEDGGVTVAFTGTAGETLVEYTASDLDEIVLAYAVSVHKAQGSEFPCVVMPVVTRHFMLLQRNLLYTAITRARQLCVLVGSKKALAIAAATDHGDRRNTALADRLVGRVPEAEQAELL
jgi:exodeoxyribonuclease V alpha subunit